MKVRDLIKALSTLDEESEVLIDGAVGQSPFIKLTTGFFATDRIEGSTGFHVNAEMAIMETPNGRQFLDLTSERVRPSVVIRFDRTRDREWCNSRDVLRLLQCNR